MTAVLATIDGLPLYRHSAGDILTIGGDVFPFDLVPAQLRSWAIAIRLGVASGDMPYAEKFGRPAMSLVSAYVAAVQHRRASGCLNDLSQTLQSERA